MQTNQEDLFVRVPQADADESTTTPSQSPFRIQRTTLTLLLSAISLILALSAAAVSLYIYKAGLQGLQHAQTAVQLGTVNKLVNETKTTAAEARYAEEMNRLQTANENLKTELLASQTALARAERERAAADAGLKGIDLGLSAGTIGDPEFQRAVSNIFQQVVTPFVACVVPNQGESKAAFDKRCQGKDLSWLFKPMTPPSPSNSSSKSDPFGLAPPAPKTTPVTVPPRNQTEGPRRRLGQ